MLALLALSCAAPRPPAASGTAVDVAAEESVPAPFVPSLPAASAYGQPVDEPPSPEEAAIERIVQEAARAAAVGPPAWDGRLARVAADLASAVPDDGPPPGRLVDFVARHHGMVETSPHLVVLDVEGARTVKTDRVLLDHLRAVLSESPGKFTLLGVGMAGRRVVIALGERHVEIAPVARRLARGERVEITATVLPPYTGAGGYLQVPDGTIRPLARQGTALSAAVACEAQAGRFQVEITGQDRFGTAVLANFPIWCEVDPPAQMAWAPEGLPPRSAEEAEAAILALVQRDRRTAGLSPLRADPRLAALSRAHSEDMRDARFVGHVSPGAGGPAERARRSGVKAAVLLENVARAYTPEDIQQSLLESPGHRENILDPRVTHLGVGVALGQSVVGRRELWVTQTFARY